MISHKHKCIFIHINKCAGSSIETFFSASDPDPRTKFRGHYKAVDFRKHLYDSPSYNKYGKRENWFRDYFKFSFVRNPWDRACSHYHDQIRRGWDFYPRPVSFETFVKKFLKKLPMDRHGRKRPFESFVNLSASPCFDWLVDENGNIIVDFVGRFENLRNDFNIVCDKIGIPQRYLPHVLKTNHKHYTEYYNNETRKIIAERYARDIRHFGYKFGE